MAGRNVSYVKQKTPSFIQKFKEQVGYKEGPDVETKRSTDISDTLDDNELEDEKPAVVLANNVSEVEATKFLEKLEAEKNGVFTSSSFLWSLSWRCDNTVSGQ